MIKVLFVLCLLLSSVTGQSFHFSELRYSDAINHYTQLNGTIDFQKDSLEISYKHPAVDFFYDGEDIVYTKDGKEMPLDATQKAHMMQYFDILKMLHVGDESELKSEFTMSHSHGFTLLKPTGTLRYYIEKIELTKENNLLEYVKLYLKNNDYITINIDNEIH
jgi:cytochrome oxidase Cu insertion factor (SCO1/SenC/PrrC family)